MAYCAEGELGIPQSLTVNLSQMSSKQPVRKYKSSFTTLNPQRNTAAE